MLQSPGDLNAYFLPQGVSTLAEWWECTTQVSLPDAPSGTAALSCRRAVDVQLGSTGPLSPLTIPQTPSCTLPWACPFSASGSSTQAHCGGQSWVVLLLLLTCLITKGPLGSSSLQNVPATAQEGGARKRLWGAVPATPAGPPLSRPHQVGEACVWLVGPGRASPRQEGRWRAPSQGSPPRDHYGVRARKNSTLNIISVKINPLPCEPRRVWVCFPLSHRGSLFPSGVVVVASPD